MPETRNNSGDEPSEQQLDALLTQARWPELQQAAMQRIDASIVRDQRLRGVEPSRPPRPLAPGRRLPAWLFAPAALAALLALAVTLWAIWPAQQPGKDIAELTRQPSLPEPLDPMPAEPRLTYAVLMGRPATDVEMAWVQVIRREREKSQDDTAAPESPPSQPQIAEDQPGGVQPQQGSLRQGVAPSIARRVAPAVSSDAELLAALLDSEATDFARAEAARRIAASSLEAALRQPRYGARRAELLWALTLSRDPAAALVLVRAAEREDQAARQAIASASAGAPAVHGLIRLLDDPVVPRREAAAMLLAASQDPSVYDLLARRLSSPGSRRETLIALMASESSRAQEHLARAQTSAQIRAIVHSLRIQGVGRRQLPQPVVL